MEPVSEPGGGGEGNAPEPPEENRLDTGLRGKVRGRSRPQRHAWHTRLWRWVAATPRASGREWSPSYRGTVEPPQAGVRGICCSGGGIRSAAFNLGALQRLDEEGILEDADYLAAVSGGSYLAAAFSMVAPRGGMDEAPADGPFGVADGRPLPRPFAAGSPEEQYLRNRTGYMAPGGVAMVVLIWRFIAGALASFLLIASPLAFAAYVLTEVLFEPAFALGTEDFSIPLAWTLIAPGVAVVALVVGWLSMTSLAPDRLEAWAARLLVAAGILAVAVFLLPLAHEALTGLDPEAGGIGISAATLSFLGGVAAFVREALVPPRAEEEGEKRKLRVSPETASRLRIAAARIAGAVMGPLLIGALAYGAMSVALHTDPGDGWVQLAIVAIVLVYGVLWWRVDLTGLSMHRVYRRRLSSAFALRRARRDGRVIAEVRDEPVKLSTTSFGGKGWPVLLVCAAANVSDEGATPRGREVTSFTFSPYTVGGPLVGAFSTSRLELGHETDERSEDVTLPAAVAMSGAALAPSMGKLTKRSLRFLMTLANVRLGVWVPNPAWADERFDEEHQKRADSYLEAIEETGDGSLMVPPEAPGTPRRERGYGRPRLSFLFRELLGRNYLDSPYLYVTDGGHYENLGLVELLRRGCTEIWCFDASGGHDAGELGDAVALARSELGVDVDIDAERLVSGTPRRACVMGEVSFEGLDLNGTLLYCKNVMRSEESWDVRSVADRDPAFPDHSTSEQLYSEQRFEAYRKLGWDAADDAIALRARG